MNKKQMRLGRLVLAQFSYPEQVRMWKGSSVPRGESLQRPGRKGWVKPQPLNLNSGPKNEASLNIQIFTKKRHETKLSRFLMGFQPHLGFGPKNM